MGSFVTDERTGLKYELVGDYYLIAGDDEPEEDRSIGVWGQRHLRYLKEHRRVRYATLLASGELNAYLADIDRQAEELFLRLVKQMADAEGITETLKANDQMEWVGRMNSCRDRASARPVDPIRPVHLYTYCFLRKSGFFIIFIADDTTVSLEHKCHIDRSDLKHYNACETQLLVYDTEAHHEPGFNARPCHQVHAAVCHPHDFRGSIAAVL